MSLVQGVVQNLIQGNVRSQSSYGRGRVHLHVDRYVVRCRFTTSSL